MLSKILTRQPITLDPRQLKMIARGWGNEVVENTIVEKIIYHSDGLKVKGYIAYPKDQTKKYPCIIWCRGGYKNSGAIDEFNAYGMFGQLASWGYVTFAPQYRGSPGSEGVDEFGGTDLNDVLNIIPLAEEIDCADKNIWAIEGWSRGGMITYLTLTRTNIFKAAITVGGIANLQCSSGESKFMQHLYKSNTEHDKQKLLQKCYERSIINFPEKLCSTTPLLLLHGIADNSVPAQDSIELATQLKELNHPYELVLYENGDHFLKKHRKEVNEKRKSWFEKHLFNY
ncbi:MAG: prolyl oligopeptidase family serine peptidase [Bacteroidota bacterium]